MLALEPITDNLSATNREFIFGATNDTITLSDDPNPNLMLIQAPGSGESVLFTAPTTSITIHAGDGQDTIHMTSVDAAFNGTLNLHGDGGTDQLNGPQSNANWTLNGATGTLQTATINATFATFETLQGNSGIDIFTVSAASTANLAGGDNNDQFIMNAPLSGTVDGQLGTDSLSGTAIDGITLTTSSFQGTEADISGGFASIESITGNGGFFLKGRDGVANATWSVNGVNSTLYGCRSSSRVSVSMSCEEAPMSICSMSLTQPMWISEGADRTMYLRSTLRCSERSMAKRVRRTKYKAPALNWYP